MTTLSPQEPAVQTQAGPKRFWIAGLVVVGLALCCGFTVVAALVFARLPRITDLFEGNWNVFGNAPAHGLEITLQVETGDGSQPDELAVKQVLTILNQRARGFGLDRYEFRAGGAGTITARLPEMDTFDPRLKRIFTLGEIEFVDMGDEEALEGTQISTDLGSNTGPAGSGAYHTILTGEHIVIASVATDTNDQPLITFELDEQGRQVLAEHTRSHTGSFLALTLDKVVISAPRINTPITEGKGIIEGDLSLASAKQLAALMRYPKLPFALKIVGQKTY